MVSRLHQTIGAECLGVYVCRRRLNGVGSGDYKSHRLISRTRKLRKRSARKGQRRRRRRVAPVASSSEKRPPERRVGTVGVDKVKICGAHFVGGSFVVTGGARPLRRRRTHPLRSAARSAQVMRFLPLRAANRRLDPTDRQVSCAMLFRRLAELLHTC